MLYKFTYLQDTENTFTQKRQQVQQSSVAARRRHLWTGCVLVVFVKSQVDIQQPLESALHAVAIAQRKVAQNQVETGSKRRLLRHYVLKRGHCIVELTQFHERYRYVLHYLHPACITEQASTCIEIFPAEMVNKKPKTRLNMHTGTAKYAKAYALSVSGH